MRKNWKALCCVVVGGCLILAGVWPSAFVGAVTSPAPAEVSSIAVKLQANLDAIDRANKVVAVRAVLQRWHDYNLERQAELAGLTDEDSSFNTADSEFRTVKDSGAALIDKAIDDVNKDAALKAFIEFRPGQGQ